MLSLSPVHLAWDTNKDLNPSESADCLFVVGTNSQWEDTFVRVCVCACFFLLFFNVRLSMDFSSCFTPSLHSSNNVRSSKEQETCCLTRIHDDQSKADYSHYASTMFECVHRKLNLLLNDNMTISSRPLAETRAPAMSVPSLCSLWHSVMTGHVGFQHVSSSRQKKSWWLLPSFSFTNCGFCR